MHGSVWLPQAIFRDLEEIGSDLRATFELLSGSLRICCEWFPCAGATRLVVLLRNVCTHAQPAPVFLRWPFPSDSHVLKICDPSLLLDENITLGCFIGSEREDPLPGILELVSRIAAITNVDRDRTLYFGASGAGFAALMCGIKDGNAIGVALNPEIDLARFDGSPIADRLLDVFRPNARLGQVCNEYPTRFSVIEALKEARKLGPSPQLLLLQNTTDEWHYEVHYTPFCEAFGISVQGGFDRTGALQAVLYDVPGGHLAGPEYEPLARYVPRLMPELYC